MSTTGRAHRLEVEAAQRRVVEHLSETTAPRSPRRRLAVLGAALTLFAVTFAARLAVDDPDALLANFYVVPIALLAIEFGTRAGILAAGAALGLVLAWSAIQTVHVTALGYASRAAALLVTGALIGRFSERLRQDIPGRRRAQRDLSLYADQLARANQHLARTVDQLEAFAEIARAVGGETDLPRILSLILEHAREIVPAQRLVLYLPDGEELVAAGQTGRHTEPLGRRVRGSVAGEVLLTGQSRRVSVNEHPALIEQLSPGASAVILVPIMFRGERLGVLAGIDRAGSRGFDEEDEQLLRSVAASAATAVATARSVAATRLRLSVEAADEARARWARELHDETLQGLTGVRMVLSAGRASDELAALQQAAETADRHLGEETRKLRDLISELRPAALDDLGLGPAIESLAARKAAVGGFRVDVKLNLDTHPRLERDAETAIYRIVQEALTNAAKHARAQRVALSVDQRTGGVEVAVLDDGCGFDPSDAGAGFGVTGMRERALLLGGSLTVSSAAGGPTRVLALLPTRC